MSRNTVDCIVVGTGPAGLAAALALAREGFATAAVGAVASTAAGDLRTAALFSGSVAFLRHLGTWPLLEADAAPLTGLRLIDDTGTILRAPETLFRAEEIDVPAFGYNVENARLVDTLLGSARSSRGLRLIEGQATDIEFAGDGAVVTVSDGARLEARLVVGADGRNSLVRARAGIEARHWSYPQWALVTRFRHARPHEGISTEFHRTAGPLTTVPLPGNESSLVWVEDQGACERLMGLTADELTRELETRLQGLLGTVTHIGPRAAFPLAGLSADRMAAQRVALIGEAAHVLPPIGAQGLNLGLRDAATLAEVATDARASGRQAGDEATLADYEARRKADVASRTIAVDLLNRSLVLQLLPLHIARGAGLHVIRAVPWLRKLIMQEGMQPANGLPRLMRQ